MSGEWNPFVLYRRFHRRREDRRVLDVLTRPMTGVEIGRKARFGTPYVWIVLGRLVNDELVEPYGLEYQPVGYRRPLELTAGEA